MIKYKIFTDPGSRSVNEDAVGVSRRNEDYCFILADGLGGHGSGDIASTLVVNTIKEYFQTNGEVSSQCLASCINLAQERLLEAQVRLSKNSEMKTTIVVLAMNEKNAVWAHVGDSRLYRIRRYKNWIRTLDHSVPQMLVTMGEITEDQIRGHVDRNRLIKVLGVEWDEPQYEISPVLDVEKKDAFLLCSDGFWEFIDEKSMLKTLKYNVTPDKWIEKMTEIIKKNGNGKDMDNYSAIVVTNLKVKIHNF